MDPASVASVRAAGASAGLCRGVLEPVCVAPIEARHGHPMKTRPINAADAPVAVGGYSQAFETVGSNRRLYVSGQIPVTRSGEVPADFRAQAKLVWANVAAQLDAANMTIENLTKVTIFLSDRKFAAENREERQAALGNHAPALTVVIVGIFDDAWLLEIEAIAEA